MSQWVSSTLTSHVVVRVVEFFYLDWVALDLPSYPQVVEKPMDLSTMRKRLDNHE
jgi:hypothetical protein